MATISPAAPPSTRPQVLVVDTEEAVSAYGPYLNPHFQVNAASRVAVANEYFKRVSPALVITEIKLEDGAGIDVCRAAKTLPVPATVLVTTEDPGSVPDALAAGCDGVLLKPFAPNLLVSRVGRLLRNRASQLQIAAARTFGKAAHLSERMHLYTTGTNRVWPNTHCPHCAHPGVTSFDYAAMRKAWFACLQCKRVWMAKRQD